MLMTLDVTSLSVCITKGDPNAHDFLSLGVCTECVP